MNTHTIPAGLQKPQRCDPKTFFYILEKIDLTTLKDAIAGPQRRGRKLKKLDVNIRLYLWHLWRVRVGGRH